MIPRTFKLANRTWRVKWVDDPELRTEHDKHVWGDCGEAKALIRLNRDLLDEPEEFQRQVFEHELMHAHLYAFGISDHDETFVDGMAALRCQYLQTLRGDITE